RRWIRLSNANGSLEALEIPSLTFAAGSHALFNGVKEWTVVALPKEPQIATRDGVTRVSAPGVTVEFRGVRIERGREAITVRLQ
ncbi:MAG TPA: hypothetical protein VFL57_21125, partial [Bryobacteraceae bacterium]|nr:hypothetical protein [Bryobacteraceae bacterium]